METQSDQLSTALGVREHSAYLKDGRKVILWTLDRRGESNRIPILIGSGFGRRMDHFAALALYLTYAGFPVIRYDSVDHVGLSDGVMEDYTLSTGLSSLETAVEWTCAHLGVSKIGVVATSLTARLTYELLPRCPAIDFLISVVGVVDVRATCEQVFGHDYSVVSASDLPDYVSFERQRINVSSFYQDYHRRGWGTAEQTVRVLKKAPQPIVGFVAERDPWVDATAVREVFAAGGGPRRVVELVGSGHNLGSNPTIARAFMCGVTNIAHELSNGNSEPPNFPEPHFSQLVEQALVERRMQRRETVASQVEPIRSESIGGYK